MPLPSLPADLSREPLLHLEDNQLAWVGLDSAGELRYGSVALPDRYPADVAAQALHLAKELGLRPRRVVLSLGATMLAQHVLRLPPAETQELGGVFSRRCQGWLDCSPGEVEYVALPHQAANPEALETGRDWSVFCIHRRLLLALLLELRKLHITVSRCVSERAGAWAEACRTGGNDGACLVIAREHRETSLALLQDGHLMLSTALAIQPGLADEAGAVAMVHEVRNLAGWWRKESRGQKLQRVVLFGLEDGLVSKLVPALHAAVGAAEVQPQQPPIEGQWRLPSLLTGYADGTLAIQLGLRLPPAPRRVLSAGTALAVALVGVGLVFNQFWSKQRESLSGEFEELGLLEQQVARYEVDAAELRQALSQMHSEVQRIDAVAARRWPVETALEACRAAMPNNTRLVDIALRQDGEGMHLTATGEAPSDPEATRQALASIQAYLEQAALFTDLELEPPSQIGVKQGQSGLTFSIRAQLRPSSAEIGQ